MDIIRFFSEAVSREASDIFIIAGKPASFKVHGEIREYGDLLHAEETYALIHEIYRHADRDMSLLNDTGDDDFSFSINAIGRFRVNAYKQRGSLAAVLRLVLFELPDHETLGIPKEVIELHKKTKGLVLVTGPAGSGKSTTLACIIDKINHNRNSHIITLEDPIEHVHRHSKSIVSQREVALDTASYAKGLRAALRESPDVILLGEMRDYETISIAMSAAETGQLVFSTLHTLGAANAIDRIIDVFPPSQQQQVRVQLSMVLQAVISQQLIPSVNGVLVPVFEVMFVNSGIRNMIRESKIHQIDSIIYSSTGEGMRNMDAGILKLYDDGIITADTASYYSMNHDMVNKKIEAGR
ncbi:MAG: type IV pili twitching motility protein PilT [Firmicutes bacterium HGW-Firmicutes-11]|jgi:twitching motility protein PilT|nr:MAG: type IV pili twitching motility protein PilT [Firmicutes bacterium HGW-Firmicutes-11]